MREFLRRLLRWLAELLGLREDEPERQPPARAALTLEVIDMDLIATATWPTQRAGGRPLPQSQIAQGQFYLAVVDEDSWYEPWGDPVVPDGADAVSKTQPDIDLGEWFVRFVVTDTQAEPKSSTATASIVVGSGELAAPGTAGLSLETADPNAG